MVGRRLLFGATGDRCFVLGVVFRIICEPYTAHRTVWASQIGRVTNRLDNCFENGRYVEQRVGTPSLTNQLSADRYAIAIESAGNRYGRARTDQVPHRRHVR